MKKDSKQMSPAEVNQTLIGAYHEKRGERGKRAFIDFAQRVQLVMRAHGVRDTNGMLRAIERNFPSRAAQGDEPEVQQAPAEAAPESTHWTAGAINLAAEHDLDQADVESFVGSDRITKGDVEAYLELQAGEAGGAE